MTPITQRCCQSEAGPKTSCRVPERSPRQAPKDTTREKMVPLGSLASTDDRTVCKPPGYEASLAKLRGTV